MARMSSPTEIRGVYKFGDVPQDGTWQVALFIRGADTEWIPPGDLNLPPWHLIYAQPNPALSVLRR